MKNIAFFSKNLRIGGMEKALVSLVNRLVDDYNITIILEEIEGELLDNLDSRINVQEYHLSASKNILCRKIYNFLKRNIWSFLNKNKYYFSCNFATYSVICSKLAQAASLNSCYYVHSNYNEVYGNDTEKIKSFFEDHNLEDYRHIVFVSNESKNGLESIYPNLVDKFIVINNIIDYDQVKKMAELPCDFRPSVKDYNFIWLGRFDNDSKNIDLLLESFREVAAKDDKRKLYMVGDGPYWKETRDFITKNNLQNNIILLGKKINPYGYLNKCDVFISTSNYEGFPVTYIEALILNKAIMTTISCSDESLCIDDYVIHLPRNSKEIANKILNYKKEKKNYNINYEELNRVKLENIKKLIER